MIKNAATVIILRKKYIEDNNNICNNNKDNYVLEVLLGQNEVKNYLKSSDIDNFMMRYPGEYKYPGGVCDDTDIDFKATAIRELKEEFIGVNITIDESLFYLFSKKYTLPIKNKSFCMYNFITIIDSENEWISDETVIEINNNLKIKRELYNNSLKDKSYWNLNKKEKELLSPEVHSVCWIDINEAIDLMNSADSNELIYINEFQRQEFIKYNITIRDSMYQSKIILEEIRDITIVENLIKHAKKFAKNIN